MTAFHPQLWELAVPSNSRTGYIGKWEVRPEVNPQAGTVLLGRVRTLGDSEQVPQPKGLIGASCDLPVVLLPGLILSLWLECGWSPPKLMGLDSLL